MHALRHVNKLFVQLYTRYQLGMKHVLLVAALNARRVDDGHYTHELLEILVV